MQASSGLRGVSATGRASRPLQRRAAPSARVAASANGAIETAAGSGYDQYADCWDTSVVVDIDGEEVRFFHAVKKGVHRVFVDHPWFLAKVWGKTGARLYGSRSGADYADNHARFNLFCRAAIEASRALPFGAGEDVAFVANDWHAALLPVLLKARFLDVYQPRGEFVNAKAALCIHNIAFQGRFWPETFGDLGLPESSRARFAFTDGYDRVFTETEPLADDDTALGVPGTYPKLNWLKAGMLAADKVLTVSPNYAAEIAADPSGGVELDDVIRAVGGAEGIVNGMDLEEWDPAFDKYLPLPGVAAVVKFSAPLAHLITGGADYIMVPSRFEPCGLIQLHAMHPAAPAAAAAAPKPATAAPAAPASAAPAAGAAAADGAASADGAAGKAAPAPISAAGRPRRP
ncbi:granule-bound starch synthase [Raphidocelis subcapitata]|uniref:Granule-bound starch synthase n=1 Tax=Raphidocelis subcapitata TaxID=307507 RepID=A0A2V0NZP2_9CHLO|nr:granule-bound starch synthase [Raphidocelis subcapitata]|eukprot:GBF91060.1 granule-bound starch synthase [Raphidocelis subcapitata]